MLTKNIPLVFLILWLVSAPAWGQARSKGDVYVLLWFDTEDYLLPESDDALLRICRFLSDEGIRATFKVVGEKARVLEKRQRLDVLSALSKHEVGYHTNFHSVPPSPAMYLSRLGWFEGIREFERREGQGLLDVARITGQYPVCYGQPGSSWGPQQYGALRNWKVPVYLDDGRQLGMEGRPFWYAGILTFFNLEHTIRTELGSPQDLRAAVQEFDRTYSRLKVDGGGVVSIYYHPCEFVHARFWDAVNFTAGADPDPSDWKIPPLKTPEQIEAAFGNFESYIRRIYARPDVHFITPSQATELYPDRATNRFFRASELVGIARRMLAGGIEPQEFDGLALAPSEVFYLLAKYLSYELAGRNMDGIRLPATPLGPVRLSPGFSRTTATVGQFQRTLRDVVDFLELEKRIPDVVWPGSSPVSPESFLVTLAQLIASGGDALAANEAIAFEPAELGAARHVRNDPDLWGWVIFPPGFQAPGMMELAKRQAWTLKPALLRP